MTKLGVRAPLRRVGNVLALFIPADATRKGHLQEGQVVDADIETEPGDLFGFLKGKVPYRPFRRSEEGLWRDRV